MSAPPPTTARKQPKQTYLPLRELTIPSRPLIKRAIQFSCDGDLAVAADDSVHVFVPEFPDLSRRRERVRALLAAFQSGQPLEPILAEAAAEEDESLEEEEGGQDGVGAGGGEGGLLKGYSSHRPLRAQYSEGGRHIPVSFPPVDPRVNKPLFVAAGEKWPFEGWVHADGTACESSAEGEDDEDYEEPFLSDDEDGDRSSGQLLDDDDDDDFGLSGSEDDNGQENGGGGPEPGGRRGRGLKPKGAGYGPITGPGSSMNHVVCIAWSPPGLGVNRRPVLAVLGGAGTLVVYGDAGPGERGGNQRFLVPRAKEGMLQVRDLSGWVILFGAGERLVLPGQQTEVSECLKGFAWAREIGPGQALLATVNDLGEVAVVSVQCMHDPLGSREDGGEMEGGDEAVWLVREVARFKAETPHKPSNPLDPDWTPYGTSFGLRWSPWLESEDCRTCVLSFTGHHYVGFRKVTIRKPWVKGKPPDLEVEDHDTYGLCLHLSTDSFVEFEDAVWTHGDVASCRGLISTGFSLKQFEVALRGGPTYQPELHSVWDCRTVYRDDGDEGSQNTICDLIMHPPDLSSPGTTPLYTLVRVTATSTTPDWYETNVPPLPDDAEADPRPQWARTMTHKLDVQLPADMHLTRAYDDSGSEGTMSDSDDDDDDEDDDGGDEDDDDENGSGDGDLDMDDDGGLDVAIADEGDDDNSSDGPRALGGEATLYEMPQIHPHRFRIHGLALSPGGGVSAALVSSHSTQHPERGGWHTVKSSVLFSYRPRRRLRRLKEIAADLMSWSSSNNNTVPIDPQFLEQTYISTISTTRTPSDIQTLANPYYTRLTTEAKLFEHLYGGAPEVPGVHFPAPFPTATNSSSSSSSSSAAAAASLTLQSLLSHHTAFEAQTCDLCSLPLDQRSRGPLLLGCKNGHYFSTCAMSGLAVQTPGATRRCGACGRRTLRAGELLGRIERAAAAGSSSAGKEGNGNGSGLTKEKREEVVRLLGSGLCAGCGGKFLS